MPVDITPTRILDPTTGGITIVPRYSFDTFWEPRGWVLAPEGSDVTVPNALSSGRRLGRVEIAQNFGPTAVNSLGLVTVPGLLLAVPVVNEPVCLRARLNVSHTVAGAQVAAAIAPVGAALVDTLWVDEATCGAVGKLESLHPEAEIDPRTGGDWQVYILGDSGNMTVVALDNAPAVLKATAE